MLHWSRRLLVVAAPLLLTGCLWGPGKFQSDLTVKKDNSFVLNYRGEIVIQLPPDTENKPEPWKPSMARCHKDGEPEVVAADSTSDDENIRACTAAETAKLKAQYEKQEADRATTKRKDNEEMAKAFGLPGLDDASNRAFAAKLMKYAGWRSVTYRGKGVFDV